MGLGEVSVVHIEAALAQGEQFLLGGHKPPEFLGYLRQCRSVEHPADLVLDYPLGDCGLRRASEKYRAAGSQGAEEF